MAIAAGLFVGQLPDRLGRMRAAVADRRSSDLRRLAHQLKGSGGGFGFPEISVAAGAVERLASAVTDAADGWAAVEAAMFALTAVAAALPGYSGPDNAADRRA